MAEDSQNTHVVRLREFVAQEHFRYKMSPEAKPRQDEFTLQSGMGIKVDAPDTPLMKQAIGDFVTFCDKCMDIRLQADNALKSTGIVFQLTGTWSGVYNVLDPAGEAFTVRINPEGIVVEAAHERGLLHSTHYLERMMADRGGPFFEVGEISRSPRFIPRITNAMGVEPHQRDAYMSMLSHFGVNAVNYGVDLWSYSKNSLIKELNNPECDRKIEKLNSEIEFYNKHGMDVYFCMHNSPIRADHPVFTADPNRMGAPYRVFDDMKTQYVLCSSNPEVLACQEEAMAYLFKSVPGAAGALFLLGGEGYMHCYSRPYGKFEGYSSCPRCKDKAPSGEVANLINRLAAAIKSTGKHKPVFAWPYSAFTWSGSNDRAQLEWMRYLSDDVLIHSNFDTGSEDVQNKAGVFLYDYNIKSVGPSETFKAQAKLSDEMGKKIYTKIETNCTPSVHFDAYIPVYFRWRQRYEEMANVGVAGFQNQWAFFGPNGTPPEEIQYHAVWNPERDAEYVLKCIAQRDLGLQGDAASKAIEAWKLMSEAWDDFPYSAMTNGEREFYMRGPLHYGPSHPLIFNTQHRYWLSSKFYGLSGDLASLATPEELEVLLKEAKPRYVSELLMVLPFGVRRYLELITACKEKWVRGVKLLKESIGPNPNERAQMELDICETLEIHFVTMENVVRFYDTRDLLGRVSFDLEGFKKIMEDLSEILRSEIANAERSLPIVERDWRIATYDADMVREKIKQCKYVLKDELPIFDVTTRFHIWNDFL